MRVTVLLMFCLSLWIPAAVSVSSPPEDQDTSGDDLELSGSGSGYDGSDVDVVFSFNSAASKTTQTPTTAVLCKEPEKATVSLTTIAAPTGRPVTTVPAGSGGLPEKPLPRTTSAPPVGSPRAPAVATTRFAKPRRLDLTPSPPHASGLTTTPADVDVDVKILKDESALVGTTRSPRTTSPAAGAEVHDSKAPPGEGGAVVVSTTTTTTTSTTSIPTTEGDYRTYDKLNEEIIVPNVATDVEAEGDSDIVLEAMPKENRELPVSGTAENQSLLERKEVLAGVIAGGAVGLAFAIMLVSLMVYRMKKKDEGSYALDDQKHSNGGYMKPQKQEEFLA